MNFSIDHLEVTAAAIDAGDNLGSMGLEQCYPARNGRVTPANKRREFDHFLDWHSGFSQASKNSDPLDVAMTVKYRTLGKTGLLVSPIALGTMQFGWSADEATSHSILSAYVDAGGNLIDTADVYSVWAPNNAGGVSEEIIGRWLKATGKRDRVLVATKVRGAMGQNFSEGDDHPLQREGLSRGDRGNLECRALGEVQDGSRGLARKNHAEFAATPLLRAR